MFEGKEHRDALFFVEKGGGELLGSCAVNEINAVVAGSVVDERTSEVDNDL